MTSFLVIVAALVLVSAVALARGIRRDGLGHRPPPASHEAWTAGRYRSTPPGRA
ncbi:hypothetical protein Bcav_1270 [Beutenbergia cavernae DSM 12333]|uniref:Uncharacterized protein n=1 Tax=Beutenbergia cavernae (strain ATCC BAA-8 / DSM 12333 / CCUG 43141 / JCM 11478 / NBRC 16432 / NCIMB 13614 / HKI 0122) TaxID=471853 RepID=C5C1R2_BEUC1|nr:hypothetical protein [Beutenbergia cavernae]ACQ79530.1 hypothetical protein Bcav_1270 [Beutenbergia cavernae DSM 12333]